MRRQKGTWLSCCERQVLLATTSIAAVKNTNRILDLFSRDMAQKLNCATQRGPNNDDEATLSNSSHQLL